MEREKEKDRRKRLQEDRRRSQRCRTEVESRTRITMAFHFSQMAKTKGKKLQLQRGGEEVVVDTDTPISGYWRRAWTKRDKILVSWGGVEEGGRAVRFYFKS